MPLAALALTLSITGGTAGAQEKLLNLYSSRHYQTDEALYANFTKPPASSSTASRPAKIR